MRRAAIVLAACTASTITPTPSTREADPTVAIAPAGPTCRRDADCAAGKCFVPDFHPIGGGHAECAGDSACGEGRLCRASHCQDRCTATSCAPGQECDRDGDCVPRRCNASTASRVCPMNFSCSAGVCERAACTSDRDCAGACVDRLCYAALGFCADPSLCCPP